MKTFCTILILTLLLLANDCNAQGVKHIDISDYLNVSDKSIKGSVSQNIHNLNPIEYSYSLPELCELLKEGKVTVKSWKSYIDSLNLKAIEVTKDTLASNLAIYSPGLIQKQIQFLINSISANRALFEKYPNEVNLLLKNTTVDNSLSTNSTPLIKISDVAGETNFWFFLQVADCDLIDQIVQERRIPIELLKTTASHLTITSTYKNPYSLQKRKLKGIQQKLLNTNSKLCKELSERMNKRIITIEDKNKNFYKEHSDWHLLRTF